MNNNNLTNQIPTKQELLQAMESISLTLKEVASNNDHTIKQTDNLKIILLNLKIQSAHVKQPNGISPIALELQKITTELHDKTYNTVTTSRASLISNLNIIGEYVKNIKE